MTLLFGMVATGGEPVPQGVLDRIERCCDWPRDRALRYQTAGAAMLALQRDTTPRIGEARLCHEGGPALLFAGRLDNREEIAARFGLGPADALADEDLVAAAWRADGPDACRALIGDFAIALYDSATGKLLLARDQLGVMPLYHARVGPFLAFASGIEPLRHVPGVTLAWDDRWLADTLTGVKNDVERTAYRAIRAVPPAHTLTFDAGCMTAKRFWSLPTYGAPLRIGPEEATAEFRRLFDRAVSCRLRRVGGIASELSGGLDSTSVAATAAPGLVREGARLHAFSHALPDSDLARRVPVKDERPQIEALLAMTPGIEHHWVVNALDSQVAVLARAVARHGAFPRNDLNAYGEELPDALRERDIRVLLSGFGGDQLVTHGGGGFLESLLAERDHETLRALMTDRHGAIGGTLRAVLYRSGLGRIALARGNRRKRAMSVAGGQLAQPDFLESLGLSARAKQRWAPGSGTMRAREAAMIAGPQMAYRLQDSAIGAAARGFEYRYPMLDIRLLEFCHNLPARLKRTPTVRRRMIREAMAGRLPDTVRLRDDKSGSTIPTVHLNQVIHAGELAELIARHRDDPQVVRYARVGPVLETLAGMREGGGFEGPASKNDLLLLVFLCLWAERDAKPLAG